MCTPSDLEPGPAPDTGCGHGAEAEWLTEQGWQVNRRGVAPGGLLLVGHQRLDPATGEATPAAGQQQVSLADADTVLDPGHWRIEHAEEPRRPDPTSGVDAVIRAVRRA